MTLDEIVQEAERLERLTLDLLPGEAKANLWREREALARRSFPRLLAVARAAVEHIESMDRCEGLVSGEAALRRAVRGEGAELHVLAVNHLPALLDAVEAAKALARAERAFETAPISGLDEPTRALHAAMRSLDAALAKLEVQP